jgi:hypothetical protein
VGGGAARREKANTGENTLVAVVASDASREHASMLDVWRLDVWRLDVWRLDVWRRASTDCPTKLVAPRRPAASAAPLFRAGWGSRCIANGRTVRR